MSTKKKLDFTKKLISTFTNSKKHQDYKYIGSVVFKNSKGLETNANIICVTSDELDIRICTMAIDDYGYYIYSGGCTDPDDDECPMVKNEVTRITKWYNVYTTNIGNAVFPSYEEAYRIGKLAGNYVETRSFEYME